MVPSRLRASYIISPESAADRGLEFLILTIIAMNGEKMAEGAF